MRWQKRDLSIKRYVYCWADGIHLEARLEDQAQCILVIIGATPEGKKELVGFTDGLRESSQSWRDLLLDLKRRGLTTAPRIAVADDLNEPPHPNHDQFAELDAHNYLGIDYSLF